MNEIRILDKNTIDRIAAGEVIERPANVVKELVENSIDAGASAISVQISGGGTELIRVTDNGSGIEKDQIRTAFMRYSTSKINSCNDLSFIKTLGFRGEALSSIAAVSKTELCTKTEGSLTGTIYKIFGGEEISLNDAGLADGTTVIIRDLFYNVPARRKFLKSERAEGNYVSELVMKLALSCPDISFKLIVNGNVRFSTVGNGSLKDAIYAVYGRTVAFNLLKVNFQDDLVNIDGYIGKPEMSRGNRGMELFFVNNRLVRDIHLYRAAEDAYSGFQMKGNFPIVFININIEPELVDVNVHPAKTEIRFKDGDSLYRSLYDSLKNVLAAKEMISDFTVGQTFQGNNIQNNTQKVLIPEPFEIHRMEEVKISSDNSEDKKNEYKQIEFESKEFLSKQAINDHKIIGAVFDTYWIVEYIDKIFIIDQHAAHEKVLYEKFLNKIRSDKHYSQELAVPLIVTLNPSEAAVLSDNISEFNKIGFEIEHFGGSEYIISAVPADMYTLSDVNLFMSFIGELSGDGCSSFSSELLHDRIATAACKAAVKGGNKLSYSEAKRLIEELLMLENPYNCPHGRPTIITISKSELERKFKRLL